jgi:hypothetical protein
MSDVTNYLRQETLKAQRTLRVAVVAMSLVLLVFVGYFEWLKKELAAALTPESLAEFAVNEARSLLPGMTEALKANIRNEAPNVVHFVMRKAVDEALPLLGQTFDVHLKEYASDITEIATGSTGPAFGALLDRYKEEQKAGANKNRPIGASQLATFIEAQLPNALSTHGRQAIDARLAETGSTLKQINGELIAMAGTNKLSREDELGRKLITTWWTFLDRGRVPAPGEEPVAPAKADANK